MAWKNRKIFVVKDRCPDCTDGMGPDGKACPTCKGTGFAGEEIAKWDPSILMRAYYAAIDKNGGADSYKEAWRIYSCLDNEGKKLPDDKLPTNDQVNGAEAQITAIAAETFKAVGVKPWAQDNDAGWLEQEFRWALEQFIAFLSESKKNIKSSPGQSPLAINTAEDLPIVDGSGSTFATPTLSSAEESKT